MLIRKKIFQVLFMLSAVGLLSFGNATPGNTQEKAIVLKGISAWPLSLYVCHPYLEFQKRVNERLKGRVIMTYLGGNEVIPSFEQFEGLRHGMADVAITASSYYTGQLPESHSLLFAPKGPAAMRKSGFYDLMRKIHLEKGNVVFLVNIGANPGKAFRLFVNKKITKPDLTGMKIRVTPVYIELIKALGGTPITMPPADLYTALERGMVDGYGWTYAGLADYAWQEVTKYIVDHPFYTLNMSIQFNADVWKKLPPDIRNTLEEIAKDIEGWVEPYLDDYIKKEDAMYRGFGLQFIKFDPADAKKFETAAYEEGWKAFLARNPKYGPELKALAERAQ